MHKAVIIIDGNFETNKRLFVKTNIKPPFKLEFSNHLWLPFLYQPQSDVIVFEITTLQIYKIHII